MACNLELAFERTLTTTLRVHNDANGIAMVVAPAWKLGMSTVLFDKTDDDQLLW